MALKDIAPILENHCYGCGATENVMSIADGKGSDSWCVNCALVGPDCIQQIAERQAPNGNRESIIKEYQALHG